MKCPHGVTPEHCAECWDRRQEQQGGDHYAKLKVTHFDAVEAWLTPEQLKGHYLGCAVKYLTRYNADAQGKGGLLDVKKARHFLDKLIEVSE